jgi:hypothetical protein
MKKMALTTAITEVMTIFWVFEYFLFFHTKGMAKGPTQRNKIMITKDEEYHLFLISADDASKNSPQCLHFMASSIISSAQKGHFFTEFLLRIYKYFALMA